MATVIGKTRMLWRGVFLRQKMGRPALLWRELVWLTPFALVVALRTITGDILRYLKTPALVKHLETGNEPDVEATRRLIERTPDVAALVGYSEESGDWLLRRTLERGWFNTFSLLVQAGADVNCMRAFHRSSRKLSANSSADQHSFFESFEYYYLGRTFPTTLLHMAAVRGDAHAVQVLLKRGADPALPFGSAGHVLRQINSIIQQHQERRAQGPLSPAGEKWEAMAESDARPNAYYVGSLKDLTRCADLIREHVEAQWDAALPPPAPATPSTRARL